MNSQTVFARLRDALANLYPATESTRRVVDDAGLDARRIRFSAQALENWHAILSEAVREEKLDAVLGVALAEYVRNNDLLAAYDTYHRFIEQGGRIVPPDFAQDNLSLRAFVTIIKNFIFGERDDVIRLRNRQAMLNKVQAFWIEGILEHSLYKEVLIELSIEHKPDALENSWSSIIQEVGQVIHKFEPGTKIIDIFNQLSQTMLILGSPGSGKTNLLLQLTRQLIVQAESDTTKPIPVVFHLASWTVKKQAMGNWLIDELRNKYKIPRKIAKDWIENDALLLLFDGLDEVQEQQRNACVQAINQYRTEHLVQFAISSRIEEFEALTVKLKAEGAICIQALDEQQINKYLDDVGLKSQLGDVIQKDKNLLELADSPLMLNVISLAYNSESIENLAQENTVEGHRKVIFDTYIKRMFKRRGRQLFYRPRQTINWLQWLAIRLMRHSQTIFLIERMQPSWFYSLGPRVYISQISIFITMALWGPLYGLTFGLFLGLSAEILVDSLHINSGLREGPGWALLFGLLLGPIFGLCAGLVNGLFGGFQEIRHIEEIRVRQRLKSSLYYLLFWGVSFLLVGWEAGVSVGLVAGLSSWFREIELVKWSSLSWSNLRRNLSRELKNGIIFGLIGRHSVGGIAGLVIGLIIGLISGLIAGLIFEPSSIIDIPTTTISHFQNQIKSYTKYALITAISIGLVIGLFAGLIQGIEIALMSGLFAGLFGGLAGGGDVIIKHFLLHSALYSKSYIPWNYAKFLDYCADRIFLRKVGGGYIFVHRLLLEHFAAMTEEDIKRLSSSDPIA